MSCHVMSCLLVASLITEACVSEAHTTVCPYVLISKNTLPQVPLYDADQHLITAVNLLSHVNLMHQLIADQLHTVTLQLHRPQ